MHRRRCCEWWFIVDKNNNDNKEHQHQLNLWLIDEATTNGDWQTDRLQHTRLVLAPIVNPAPVTVG